MRKYRLLVVLAVTCLSMGGCEFKCESDAKGATTTGAAMTQDSAAVTPGR